MKVMVTNAQSSNVRWAFEAKSIKGGTQEQIVTALQQAMDEARNQTFSDASLLDTELVTIDKQLFKDLVYLVFKLPDFANEVCTFETNFSAARAVEATITLNPSDFLLRLSAAIRACG
ncbi:hypothetical protein [Moellerella wisconsensis]|uniref:hypothetical protein n=1 Tax=Moellerella wisconsensis TaxID=158849 RepID=UPI001F4EA07E|nr:hypothetical protein [Moellerella wisconsensis]UNH23133.1 hypothetical protein MNY68_09745 [Moellerella wisconsensis]